MFPNVIKKKNWKPWFCRTLNLHEGVVDFLLAHCQEAVEGGGACTRLMLALAQESQRSKANALKADKHREGIIECELKHFESEHYRIWKWNPHCPALKLKEPSLE